MDRLIYTALSGMRGAMSRQTVTANNLANANTVGFRAEMDSARSLWVRGAGLETRAPVSDEVTGADMSPGSINQTGRERFRRAYVGRGRALERRHHRRTGRTDRGAAQFPGERQGARYCEPDLADHLQHPQLIKG